MRHRTVLLLVVALAAAGALTACATTPTGAPAPSTRTVQLDDDSRGYLQEIDNIVNTTVVSNDPNVFKAEYEAGFMQGQLQKDSIPAGRDNSWDGSYLTDPSHSFPKQLPPSADELAETARTLRANWEYTLDYIRRAKGDVKQNLHRMVYRLVGIYDGATKDQPQAVAFDDAWYPSFSDAEMQATYETPGITFMDLYYLNTTGDLMDVLPGAAVPAPETVAPASPATASPGTVVPTPGTTSPASSKCSAFVKITDSDIYVAHNTWNNFLNQTQAMQLRINSDFMSVNAIDPGYVGSGNDFTYTNRGLISIETSESSPNAKPQVEALWTMWRSTLAEQYADSIEEFFEYISLEQAGEYMNAYMVVDAKQDKLGYTEMSNDTTVFWTPKTDGTGYRVTTKPEGRDTSYDKQMVQPDYILGFNYPASLLVRRQLQSVENRPARRRQLLAGIGKVTDVETAKALITYTAPDNPLSIFGRWDLGYGETTTPKTIPDGSVDAKVVSASMAQANFSQQGSLDEAGGAPAFWMKFGTATVNGKPFIWSESQWKDQKLRDVPDVVDGPWTLLDTNVR